MMLYLAYFALYAFVFVFGCCIGSFLNVVVYRVPLGISVAAGRSFCPGCGATLRPYDMVPVVSYLFLRGKCRSCHGKISPQYPLVEALSGALAVLVALRFGFTAAALLAFAVTAILLAIALIDHSTQSIPNGLVLALVMVALFSALAQPQPALLSRAVGFVAISLPMFLLICLIPDCFGGGDVKLVAVCGFLLGWQNILLAGFLALLLGGGYGAYLLLQSKENRKRHFAFGPALCVGIFCAMMYGEKIISWYLNLFVR